MNVEIGAEAALFPEKEYISGIFVAVHHTTAFHQKCDVCTAVKTKGQQNLQHLHSPTKGLPCQKSHSLAL